MFSIVSTCRALFWQGVFPSGETCYLVMLLVAKNVVLVMFIAVLLVFSVVVFIISIILMRVRIIIKFNRQIGERWKSPFSGCDNGEKLC
jgi:hypothetical protein